ncbi:hypothetical protein FJT64_023932 [Amphibalanus amphitrite]|uniref:SH3 domain-containing protein n=1 Tax=Amphibalanus amphitrite TaxID=1232801 RepID=A0A6A4WA15_AMPAM|nr:hypothetical protein FJT64_023932 [Amphibalanus amphitrite]
MFVRPSTGFCRTQLELIDSRGPTALLGKELTWVVSDYSAQAAGELTVSRGQQVELLDAGAPGSDLCQIRLPQTEMTGLVPAAVLQARPPVTGAAPIRSSTFDDCREPGRRHRLDRCEPSLSCDVARL